MNSIPPITHSETEPEYPESDGLPIAEDTIQFDWIATLYGGFSARFRARDDVFVAGDLFWYPVRGRPELRTAPDSLVVFGRPPGDRDSYKQWEEADIAPQVVFEIRSHSNTAAEMRVKFRFYDRFGVEEYYAYDPFKNALEGWLRGAAKLKPIVPMDGWTSPRLGMRFEWNADTIRLIRPDGRALETYAELYERAELARQKRIRAEEDAQRAEQECRQAEQERKQAEQSREQAERLAAQLRALGIDPDIPPPDRP